MSCFCEDIVAVAQGDQTAWSEMASGLSESWALLSLMRVVVSQVAVSFLQHRALEGETRDVLPLHLRGAKLAVHLGVGLPRSACSDGLARVQLLRALRVRLLASSYQTFRQDLSGGSGMSCFCKDIVALAQGDQTAWPEVAAGLSESWALLSL